MSNYERPRRRAGELISDFPWIHLGIGLFGNAAFVVGSAMFFFKSVETAAIWVFVVASTGMFIGSVGELIVRIEKRRQAGSGSARKAAASDRDAASAGGSKAVPA